jgi:DNA-binding transcriptional MerR regulator
LVERTHLSIGEVLSLLREEFPDVTISKIRFLESQGLLDPERTPSGYRKFYDDDIERLRWILRQQREHFLPLKVIKGRLSEQSGNGPTSPDDERMAPAPIEPVPARQHPSAGMTAVPASPGPERTRPEPSRPEPAPARPDEPAARVDPPARPASPPVARPQHQPPPAPTQATPTQATPTQATPAQVTPTQATPVRRGPEPVGRGPEPASGPTSPARPARKPDQDSWEYTPGGTGLTADELAAATGLAEHQVIELARYGLLTSREVGGTAYFDDEALTVARLAAGFARHGVEARHLRMYKNSAERESGLFEAIVMPLIKQRNPRAREEATETLVELSRLGGELREALLRHALGDAF